MPQANPISYFDHRILRDSVEVDDSHVFPDIKLYVHFINAFESHNLLATAAHTMHVQFHYI